jgi:hypothetical protein
VSTSADTHVRQPVSECTEGITLVLYRLQLGLTWLKSKYLLTMLPPFSMRASCGVLGFSFAFLVAFMRRERMWPPPDQWPRLTAAGEISSEVADGDHMGLDRAGSGGATDGAKHQGSGKRSGLSRPHRTKRRSCRTTAMPAAAAAPNRLTQVNYGNG